MVGAAGIEVGRAGVFDIAPTAGAAGMLGSLAGAEGAFMGAEGAAGEELESMLVGGTLTGADGALAPEAEGKPAEDVAGVPTGADGRGWSTLAKDFVGGEGAAIADVVPDGAEGASTDGGEGGPFGLEVDGALTGAEGALTWADGRST